MRISTWMQLSILCLLAGSLSARPLVAQSRIAKPKNPLVQQEVFGFGKTDFAARKDALEKGCNWLKEESGLGWSPDSDYLVAHKLVEFDAAEDKIFNDPTLRDTLEGMKVVKMTVAINSDQARDIHKQVQQQRMKERQRQALLILIGVVTLLGVVFGYLHLEEATKGYYTRLLRVAAICAVAIIAASLCVAK